MRHFVFDDRIIIAELRQRPEVRPWQRPLLWWTYRWCWRWFGNNPTGWMAVNVVIHAGNAVLLARAASGFGLTTGATIAGMALLVHPMAVMAVWTISGRSSLLMTTFGLLGVLAMQAGMVWVAAAFVFGALMVKEEAVVLPLLLWMLV